MKTRPVLPSPSPLLLLSSSLSFSSLSPLSSPSLSSSPLPCPPPHLPSASPSHTSVLLLQNCKQQQQQVFADSDSEFIAILCSFLTLPLGTIIRLLNNQFHLGCMDKLHESVKNLDVEHFQTEACKRMLMSPQSAAGVRWEDLKVKIDNTNPRDVYICPKSHCCARATWLVNFVPNARCPHCRENRDWFGLCNESGV